MSKLIHNTTRFNFLSERSEDVPILTKRVERLAILKAKAKYYSKSSKKRRKRNVDRAWLKKIKVEYVNIKGLIFRVYINKRINSFDIEEVPFVGY